jgi:uncharacterized metal-binding protein YceD (DUF177 family)
MQEFTYRIETQNLDDAGIEVAFSADASDRAALARRLGILALDRFDVAARLRRRDDGSIAVAGTLRAQVVQACVVTLDPIESAIEETFEMRYVPGLNQEARREVEVEPGDDDIEPFDGTSVDLGATAAEYLALAIDPYPRKLGAEFAEEGRAEANTGPFAELAKLRNNI